MKKRFSVLLSAAMLWAGITVSAEGIAVSVDGDYLGFDVAPVISNDRVLVPMRAIFERLGATVEWDGNTRTVTAKTSDKTITLSIDSGTMYVNGQAVALDQPAVAVDGRTLVPVRAVSEATGATVGWDGATQTVNINSGVTISATGCCFYKGCAYYWLADDPALYVWDGNANYRYAAGGVPDYIVVYNDYIYYQCEDGKLYRMNLDGSDRRILATTSVPFKIKDDRIFYGEEHHEKYYSDDYTYYDDFQLKHDYARIYSMNLDGSDKQLLVEEKGADLIQFSEGIYYGRMVDNHDFFISKDYIYYGCNYDDIDIEIPYSGERGYRHPIYRYSLKSGTKEDISYMGAGYYSSRMDKYGNIIYFSLDESDDNIYALDEKSLKIVPYSSVAPAGEEWYYKGKSRIRISDNMYETLLPDGYIRARDSETILFGSRTLQYSGRAYDKQKNPIVSEQFYAMDLDGNNIRLVNEYSNGSVVQSNVSFDNSQSTNQQTTCGVCHGLGYNECTICHGSGYVTKYTRVGTELKTCTHCGGRRHISCIVCGGDGILHN